MTMSTTRKTAISAACIRQIKFAQRQLKMSDEDYRALLRRVAGVSSSTELTQTSFALVMDEFARLGFISTKRHEAAMQSSRAPWAASYAQRIKIAAMWDAWKGEHDPEGLRRWLDHHYGVSDLHFLSAAKAQKVIGGLTKFKPRKENKHEADLNAI
jgi:hypothetical protein